MKASPRHCLTFLCAALWPATALGAPWAIVPGESVVILTGELEGQPTAVDLKSVTGEVEFDPDNLAGSRVRIAIDLGKISAGYDAIVQTLSGAAWFNVPQFPVATFNSATITKRADGRFAAEGTLTVKGITRPVTVVFTYERKGASGGATGERATAKGEATVDRTAFAIGEDSWGKSVAKDVRVTFTVVAEQAPLTPACTPPEKRRGSC